MFGNIPAIKFNDHDLANEDTFLDLAPELYLEWVLSDNVPNVEWMPWERRLQASGILDLLCIPYFGR